jgi:hemolysin III
LTDIYIMQTDNANLRLKQELVNSILHGFGILFGIISIPVLLTLTSKTENVTNIIAASIYGFCFILMFTASTLYHGFQQEKVKRTLKKLDYISIYFLIAGTYTPIVLIYQNNRFGMWLLIVLWGLTLIGSILKIFFCGRWDIISTIIYLLMGWSMLSGGSGFFKHMPTPVLTMVLAGGGFFTFGVIFYLWEKYFYSHAIWHLCVLAGAICHYFAILISV